MRVNAPQDGATRKTRGYLAKINAFSAQWGLLVETMQEADLFCLVTRAQRGDARAFDALVRRFQDRAVAYARSLLRDAALAEDAAQEAFVQAWRDLPTLQEPAAFSAWLRRIVFKYCDRIRRKTDFAHLACVPLESAWNVGGGPEPARVAEAGADAAWVRAALDRLPPRERAVALLYYLGERNIGETAAFLGLPPTTVNNRLHAARKRLRKDLWEMAQATLEQEKPSRDTTFAGNVLSRIADEFRRQMRADPHTADRSLLTDGVEKLKDVLGKPGPLDWETVRAGRELLGREDDRKAIAALLLRYLAQPLDDSQTAWAYYNLTNALACGGDPVGAVLAHEALERWLPGKHPRLSAENGNAPLSRGSVGRAYEGECDIYLFITGQGGEFADAWWAVWRGNDYLAKIDAALARCAPTDVNRDLRFYCLRMACSRSGMHGDLGRARGYVAQMYALGEEPQSESDKAHWRAKAMGHDLGLRGDAGDIAGYDALVREREALLETAQGDWVAGERHNLAYDLARAQRYESALSLLEQNFAADGHVNSWGYGMHAAMLWATTRDRQRTLALLREAPARENRDMTYFFLTLPEFADVYDDPEFRNAVQKPQ